MGAGKGNWLYLCVVLEFEINIADPDFCCGLTSPNDSLTNDKVGLSSLRPRSHNRGVLCFMFLKREILLEFTITATFTAQISNDTCKEYYSNCSKISRFR